KVYQNLGRYRESDGAFPAWLTAVARNQAIDRYRRRRQEKTEGEPALEQLAAASESPLQALEREERVSLVHRGLQALPASLREPLILCDLRGLAYEEAAEAL